MACMIANNVKYESQIELLLQDDDDNKTSKMIT